MTLLGCDVEKVGDQPGAVGYLLHAEGVTYRLMRQTIRPERLFVLNNRGHRANIKGRYQFSDEGGTLRPVE